MPSALKVKERIKRMVDARRKTDAQVRYLAQDYERLAAAEPVRRQDPAKELAAAQQYYATIYGQMQQAALRLQRAQEAAEAPPASPAEAPRAQVAARRLALAQEQQQLEQRDENELWIARLHEAKAAVRTKGYEAQLNALEDVCRERIQRVLDQRAYEERGPLAAALETVPLHPAPLSEVTRDIAFRLPMSFLMAIEAAREEIYAAQKREVEKLTMSAEELMEGIDMPKPALRRPRGRPRKEEQSR